MNKQRKDPVCYASSSCERKIKKERKEGRKEGRKEERKKEEEAFSDLSK